MKNKEINYPVQVYLNGRNVGTMDSRGTVTFTDSTAVNEVVKMMSTTAVGLSSKDSKGLPYKDNAIHFSSLGKEEDNKMEAARLQSQKKKGRMI
jgi:hypothetical protein